MRPLAFVFLLLALGLPAWSQEDAFKSPDIPIAVAESGDKTVDALVLQLVSKRPAAYREGYWPPPTNIYMMPEVHAAMEKLKELGPPIFPALVKHLGDDRYSYSEVSAAWANFSVSDAVLRILDEDHPCPYSYKMRKTSSGSYVGMPSFAEYLKDRKGMEQWAEWAKDKTRAVLSLDYLQWEFAKEKKRGFSDKAERKAFLEAYDKAFREAKVTLPKP